MSDDEISVVSGVRPDPRATVGWLSRLAGMAAKPDDGVELRRRKRLQIFMALASIPAVGLWGASLCVVGRADAGVQAFGYCAATIAMLSVLGLTRNYGFFRDGHTALVLLGPFALHVFLGGFAGSGGAVLWSLITPIAVLMFAGPKRAVVWVCLLAVALLVSLARELFFPGGTPLTPSQAAGFFTFNTLGLMGFVFFSTRYFTDRLRLEQARSEQLLLNILPRQVAERLKQNPGSIADRFDAVTVVFSDLVGFTQLSARLDAASLVALLDEVFTLFDALADQHGLEKIKTIGDAYMVVAGLPAPCADHAARAARMALGMKTAIERFSRERNVKLEMRIGVHTGEVVAGVIGKRKFSYDLWGDTVNVASRMESHGEAGRIQLSAATHAALGAGFECRERGLINVKGKGEVRTFWLEAEAAKA